MEIKTTTWWHYNWALDRIEAVAVIKETPCYLTLHEGVSRRRVSKLGYFPTEQGALDHKAALAESEKVHAEKKQKEQDLSNGIGETVPWWRFDWAARRVEQLDVLKVEEKSLLVRMDGRGWWVDKAVCFETWDEAVCHMRAHLTTNVGVHRAALDASKRVLERFETDHRPGGDSSEPGDSSISRADG